jgi:hypothetical protein
VREDGLWLGSCGVAKENSVWVMKIEEAGECRVGITGKIYGGGEPNKILGFVRV